jgi:hypothetical protein
MLDFASLKQSALGPLTIREVGSQCALVHTVPLGAGLGSEKFVDRHAVDAIPTLTLKKERHALLDSSGAPSPHRHRNLFSNESRRINCEV